MLHSETVETYDEQGNLVETRTVEWETTPEQDNEVTLRDRMDNAINGLQQITGTTGALTAAQLSNGLRLVARVCIALVRLHLRRLDSTD